MSTNGKKEPAVSTSTVLYRNVFSRKSAGLLTSALVVKCLTPRLEYNGSPLLNDIISKRWQAMFGSAVAGFGVGYGIACFINWARRRTIAALLEYKGWLFNQKAPSTKFWGIALKLLVGPGPHMLHEFDDVMPSLPVPDLKSTCARYLLSVKPLLRPEEYRRTEQLLQDLMENDGALLQDYIVRKSKRSRNWLSDWWLMDNYLAARMPIAINVNFCMVSSVLPEISTDSLARTSNILHDTMKYYEMIKDDTLPPDMVMNMIPTCMEGVRYMMSSCRIPGEHIDRLQVYPESTHIVVISHGVYYKLDMYPLDNDGHRHLMNKHEIKDRLSLISHESKGFADVQPVAVLTAQNRTKWANDRTALLSANAETLTDVESAVLIIIIGTPKPENISAMAKETFTGDGGSRWFDKSMLLVSWDGGAMGGGNMEHSGTDATHFAVMWEHVLQLEEYGPDGDLRPLKKGEGIRSNLPRPQRLEWNLDLKMKETIQKAYTEFSKTSEDLDVIVMHSEFGRSWMKSSKVSPDGFIQMAMQLTFWRLHGCFAKTYEPASHRLFALGRTDNINPVSDASVEFMIAMHDSSATSEKKIKCLKAAINFQNRARLEVTAGYGCDRHLLGLCCAAREMGRDIPAVFTDKAFNIPTRLSTSQVPTNLGDLGLDMNPESITGGFGPACEDGYGVLYCAIGGNLFNVSISSWKTCPETDSTRFGEMLKLSMRELKDLVEGKDIPVYETKYSLASDS